MLDWLFADPLLPGTAAPDFSLPDQQGKTVSLSALRGRNVALIFYPGDDTSVCRRQLCEFRDRWGRAQETNTTVLGINPQNAQSHARFITKSRLPFPLLIDKRQQIAALYHAKGLIVRRTVYLIGPDGVIRFGQRGMPDVDQVLSHAA